MKLIHELLIFCVCALLGIVLLKKKSITVSGFVALLMISGLFLCTGGLHFLLMQIYMFISSSALTRFRRKAKDAALKNVIKPEEGRNYLQALCNLGPSISCYLIFLYADNDSFIAAFIASIASANADSWASELGMLSKKRPRFILSKNNVDVGISGGITLQGSVAGMFGSVFLTSMAQFTLFIFAQPLLSMRAMLVLIAMGILGMLVDSLAGEFLQVSYSKNGRITEDSAGELIIYKGLKWWNNDFTNLFTNTTIAVLTYVLFESFNL